MLPIPVLCSHCIKKESATQGFSRFPRKEVADSLKWKASRELEKTLEAFVSAPSGNPFPRLPPEVKGYVDGFSELRSNDNESKNTLMFPSSQEENCLAKLSPFSGQSC